MIQKALDRGLGEWKAGDILGFLLSRDMQLWVAVNDGQIEAAGVTQIVTYPRKKVCDAVLCGGSGVRQWFENLATVENWARANGCEFIRAYGRRGWVRAVRWNAAQSIAIKEL